MNTALNNDTIDLAEALQSLPKTLALLPALELQVKELTAEVVKLKAANLTGWVTIQEGAKALGLTTAALRQTIARNNLAEDDVWKQNGKNSRVYVHVEKLKEAI